MTLRNGTLGLVISLALGACGHNQGGAPQSAATFHGTEKSAPARVAADESGADMAAPASPAAAPPSAASQGAGAPASARRGEAEAMRSEEPERPGLGTSWGERRESRITSTTFERDDAHNPFATAVVNYNDEGGVAAMARGRYVDWSEAVLSLGGGITVSIADPHGQPLRAAHVDGRTIAVGHDGDRYVIRVDNHSPARVETVATVDGLDVVDGGDGDLGKRGYVIPAYDSLEIEGFRESEGSVRAFRFGATDDSYASRRGKGRNVGVIGVAVFRERGSDWRWTPEEVRRRETADPFPNRFAPAPPAQWQAR